MFYQVLCVQHSYSSTQSCSSLPPSIVEYLYCICFLHLFPAIQIHYGIFHVHGSNALYVIIDIFITATPVRLLHVIHGMLYVVIYVVFSVIYTLSIGEPIYHILDWKSKPGLAAAYAVPCMLIVVPLIWLILYGLYRLRLMIADRCCGKSGVEERSQTVRKDIRERSRNERSNIYSANAWISARNDMHSIEIIKGSAIGHRGRLPSVTHL